MWGSGLKSAFDIGNFIFFWPMEAVLYPIRCVKLKKSATGEISKMYVITDRFFLCTYIFEIRINLCLFFPTVHALRTLAVFLKLPSVTDLCLHFENKMWKHHRQILKSDWKIFQFFFFSSFISMLRASGLVV